MQQGRVFCADHYKIPFRALPRNLDERIDQKLRLFDLYKSPAENNPAAISTKIETIAHLRNLLDRKASDQVIIGLVRKVEHAIGARPVLRPVLTPELATDQKRGWHDGRGTRWVLKTRIRRGTNHPFGRRDLQGHVVLSSWYFRAATDLQSAPPLPQHLASMVSGWRGRYCKLVSQKKVVSSLRKWLHKISPATGGKEAKR